MELVARDSVGPNVDHLNVQPAKAVVACRDGMVRTEGEADSGDQIYTLRLAAAPDGDVQVTPAGSAAGKVEVAWPRAPGPMVFTTANWSTEQRVRVRPVDDDDADDETATITHDVAGGGYDGVAGPTVSVAVADDDGEGAPPGGRVPDQCYPSAEVYSMISPQLGDRLQTQPAFVHGHLLLTGNGVHEFWDISNPYAPVLVSELFSPHRFGEAESFQVAFAKSADGSVRMATSSGRGIDLWNVDDVRRPVLLHALELPNINYGDVDNAVWGVAWQGDHVYVGGTTSGLYIVDASDPTRPRLVDTVPPGEMGGVDAGPVFALGNLLVVTMPKDRPGGVATLDISNPVRPVLLDFVKRTTGKSYIGWFFGRNAHLLTPFETYDVTTDPRNMELIGTVDVPPSDYMSFGDGHMFLGGTRGGSQGVWKYALGGPEHLRLVGRVPGRDDRWDDQFSIPIGNLVAVADDQNVGGFVGAYLAVHAAEPDTRPPTVEYVNPPDGSVGQSRSSSVGLSFSDQIDLASVDASTFVVRPVGGEALSGRWGHHQTVVSFRPDRPLEAETDYEVVAVAGGIADLVGNALEEDFRSVFRTGAGPVGGVSGIGELAAAETGGTVRFDASPASGKHRYRWDFGDGRRGSGASAVHSYDAPGRYTVTLSVLAPDGRDVFEAEEAALSGGVVASSEHRRHFGSGYAEFPAATGPDVKVAWRIERRSAGTADLDVRYATDSVRSLELVVNGEAVRTVSFAAGGEGHGRDPTVMWRNWRIATIEDVALDAGGNTVELVARNAVGPNVDRLGVSSESLTVAGSYSATQIVHRPLTAQQPTRSSTVVVTADPPRAWAVNPDADTVTAVDAGTLRKAFETDVGRTPRTLAQAPDGTVWVANEGSHDISVLDPGTGALVDTIELPYASMPYGVAFAPDGGAAYVTLQALGRLLRIDPATREVVHSLELAPGADVVPGPRGIAVDSGSGRVLVTRFVSPDRGGEVYDVDATGSAPSVSRTIVLALDPGPDTPDGGRGVPNYIGSVAISPDGVHARVPSKKDNIGRGVHRDGQALTHESAVRTVVSQIDLASGGEALAARIDLDDRDMAFAVAFSPLGDLLFAAVQGSNRVSVIDAYSGAPVAGIPTGAAPQGLALDDAGRLHVQNFMGRSLSVFDVGALLRGADGAAELLAEVDLVATETLSDEELQGKRIFYDASSSRMSLEGYVSCASCHLDGGHDGRTWDFTDRGEGLRNTISLAGRGGTRLHGPVHWTGNFDEIQDFEKDIRSHFGGSGFMDDDDFGSGTRSEPLGDAKAGLSAELDALAAYVSSLTRVPPSPYRDADGSLTAAGDRGRRVFATEGCAACHGGTGFTDSAPAVLHDVGTIRAGSGKRLAGTLTGFDTPTLKGVWATAPYLHDGSAATLEEAVEAHGDVSIGAAELGDLASYLRQIDELEPEVLSSDATLASLVLSGIDIGAFDAATTVYAVAAVETVSSTTVTATPSDGDATVVITHADVSTSGGTRDVALAYGSNAVAVTVTAADGETTRIYAVTVTRAAPPEATVSATAATVAEGGAARFAVSLSAAQSVALSVSVSVTAEGAGLSAPVPTSATFAAGETTAALAVRTVDDAVVSGDGTVTATLSAGAGYALGTAVSASVAVVDDDVGEFAVSAQPARIEEGGTSTLTVSIANGVTYAAAQEIALSVAGDVDASDYALPATVELAAGASSAFAEFAAAADDVDEEPETATVTASLDGAEIGAASVTVADQPPLPALRVEGVPQLGATLSAVFAEPANGPAADTARAAGGVGGLAVATSVPARGLETVYRWLRDGVEIPGATGPAHVLTAADVGAAVSVRAARGIRSEESAATVPVWGAPGNPAVGTDEATLLSTTMTLGSRGFSMVELRVDFAGYMDETWYRPVGSLDAAAFELDGTRYRLTTFAVIQDGGFAFATQPVLPSAAGLVGYWDGYRLADFVGETADVNGWTTWGTWTPQPREEYERYMHRPGQVFSGPSDGVRVAVSLRREVGVPTATVSASSATVSEGGAAEFAVSLDGPREAPVTVSLETTAAGAALAGAAPSSATFAPGETRASLDLATVDDAVVSGDGTVTVTLVAGDGYELGASTTATVSVAEDDAAQFAVSASPAEVVEGASSTVTVAIGNGVTYATAREVSLSVTGTVSASDYALPATVALAAGASSATAEFAALEDDAAAEAREEARIAATVDGAEVGAATVAIRPLRGDATLSSLSLTDADIGPFDAQTTAYAAEVAHEVASTTVTAEPSDAAAAVQIADAAGSTLGTQRTSALAEGSNAISATVTAEDGATTRTYAVAVQRPPQWGARRPQRDVDLGDAAQATGIWSDGETLWAVPDWDGAALRAYDLATGERLTSRDLTLEAGRQWTDLHADGETLWASSFWGGVLAYRLSDGARAADRDLTAESLSEAGGDRPSGVFSSGGTLWVLDHIDRKAYAHATADGARQAEQDVALGSRGSQEGGAWPWGAWTDGEVLLTSNWSRGRVLAYRLSDGAAVPAMEVDTAAAGNGDPLGLWSDGATLWVVDGTDRKVYAYAAPGLRQASADSVESRASAVPSRTPGPPLPIPDPALRAALAAALGKPPHSALGANELAALESLEARATGIADLSGLEHAVRLTALDLSGNPLADLRALASLPRLADLRLDATGAQPWDVASLAGLRRLSLRGNGIDSIEALSALRSLEHLDIGSNRIADLGPLANLHRLANLRADGNRVADVAPLLALPSLATLDLRDNPVDDTAALERLPGLRR